MMVVISDYLLPKLRAHFADRPMRVIPGQAPQVIFPAAHPEVGDIEIFDDGDEVMMVLGKFTHNHFGNDAPSLSDVERAERISEEVAGFLQEIFADRIEFFGSHLGGGGCRVRTGKARGLLSRLMFGKKTYVWSGPLDADG